MHREKRGTRRSFLVRSAGAAAMAAGARLRAGPPTTRRAAHRIAVMGCGGRFMFLLNDCLAKMPGIEIAGLCDIDAGRLAAAARRVEELTGRAPRTFSDFRQMLDEKDMPLFFNLTPDHWHALPTIMACRAGKDVFVEKPASHNPFEGRKMVEAARRYGRIVQLGTQTRSGAYTRAAAEYVRSGALGGVHFVRVVNMKQRDLIGRKPDGDPPPGVDYDAWLGPAPVRPFNPNRFHYTWHWNWDYSGGDIINDGVHQIDAARFIVGREYPLAVSSGGGRFGIDDDQETPDTQAVTWEFDDLTMVFELTLWTPYMKKMPWELRDTDDYPHWPFDGMRVEIYGSRGVMFFERHGGGWQVFDESEKVIAQQNDHHPHVTHIRNFLECVETRAVPNADIREGHLSTLLCQLGNIAFRLGRRLRFDAATERFVDDPQADALLVRKGRPPWVIPDEV